MGTIFQKKGNFPIWAKALITSTCWLNWRIIEYKLGMYFSVWFILGQKKKNCYIGVTRPTLKLGPTLHFFFKNQKKKKDKKMTDRS